MNMKNLKKTLTNIWTEDSVNIRGRNGMEDSTRKPERVG